MKNAMKKLLSLALALVLVVGVFPMAAFAAEGDTCTLTFAIKNSANGATVDNKEYTATVGGEVAVGQIVSDEYGYEVSSFATNGVVYGADDVIVAEGDARIAVNVTVEEATAPTEKEEVVETVAPTEKVEEPATYTILLNVYQVEDDQAKQWTSKNITLEKNSMTLSELVSLSGYGSYKSVSAKVNGKSFSGNAAIAIADGDQIDLFVTPNPKADKEEDKKPADKEENKKPADKEENQKPSKGETVTLRVFHNDGTSNYTDIRCKTTDGLLDVINDNDELADLTRDGYELIGWAFEANNDDGDWIAAQHKVSDDDDLRVFADWQKSKTPSNGSSSTENVKGNFLLKIYANFNTEKCVMTVNIDEYAEDGKLTWGDAYKVVSKYFEQAEDDDDMDMIGLFTKSTWNGGDYDEDDAKEKIYVDEDDKLTVYVMVYDAKLISDSDDDIVMRIYLNGNTTTVAKVVNMESYATDGKITLTEATKVINKYYEEKYDDDDMDIEGLFTASTWNSGNYKLKNAANSIKVNAKGDTIIYVMVKDAQKISSGTADSTNPKTGDTIFMAVTVMALSATALAAVYVFSKKRAVK